MLGAMRRPASLEDLVMPNVDISEDQENFYIISELPGMKEDDVKVTVGADILTISGQKERREATKAGDQLSDERPSNNNRSLLRKYHKTERAFGEFVRSFSMPKNVKETAISGTFKHGLLELTLPKIAKTIPPVREIPLETTSTNNTIVKTNGQIKSVEKAVLA